MRGPGIRSSTLLIRPDLPNRSRSAADELTRVARSMAGFHPAAMWNTRGWRRDQIVSAHLDMSVVANAAANRRSCAMPGCAAAAITETLYDRRCAGAPPGASRSLNPRMPPSGPPTRRSLRPPGGRLSAIADDAHKSNFIVPPDAVASPAHGHDEPSVGAHARPSMFPRSRRCGIRRPSVAGTSSAVSSRAATTTPSSWPSRTTDADGTSRPATARA